MDMGAGGLRLAGRAVGARYELTVAGELDAAGARSLRAALDDVLATRPDTLVLEASGVEFVDSAGLSVVLRTRQHAHDQGARFVLLDASPALSDLLRMTGLDAELGA